MLVFLLRASLALAAAADTTPRDTTLRADPAADTAALAAAAPAAPAAVRRDRPPVLTVGGQLRTRMEAVSHFQLGRDAGLDDVFSASRAIVRGALATRWVGAVVEGRHAASHGRDLPGGRRASDHDALDLQAAHVTLRCCGPARPAAELRVGRQELSVGRERLVGVSDWANTRRAFDGVRAIGRAGDLSVEAFHAGPVAVQPGWNRRDSLTRLTGVVVDHGGRWQLFALDVRQRAAEPHRRTTVGGRGVRAAAPGRPGLELEGGWQGGRVGAAPVRAWYVASEATVATAWRGRPTFAVGLDAASGDADPDDGRVGTFHVPFASGHSHGGYADVVGRPNAVEARLVSTLTPWPALQLRAAAHLHGRLRTTDAAYAKSGAALRGAAPGSRAVAAEGDLTAAYRVRPGLRLLGGYGRVAPGAFLREVAARRSAMTWAFAGVTYDF